MCHGAFTISIRYFHLDQRRVAYIYCRTINAPGNWMDAPPFAPLSKVHYSAVLLYFIRTKLSVSRLTSAVCP